MYPEQSAAAYGTAASCSEQERALPSNSWWPKPMTRASAGFDSSLKSIGTGTAPYPVAFSSKTITARSLAKVTGS